MQIVGYNDRSATLLLGSMAFLVPIMFLRIIISFILKIVIRFTGSIQVVNAYNRITKDLYFNGFITMGIEALFSYFITGYLNYKTIEYASFGEILNTVFTYFCISMVFGNLIFIIILLVTKNHEQIKL